MPIHPDRKFTPIYDRTPAELDVMIEDAITAVGREHFYLLLGGIDAYLERRRRKTTLETLKTSLTSPEGGDGWNDR